LNVCGEGALLTLQSSQGTGLDEARRDGVQPAPALAAVGLEDSFKRIAHFSSFSFWLAVARRPHLATTAGSSVLFRRI
jgi:hypothetical protein